MATYFECGICGYYHLTGFFGDCRDDSQRFTWGDIKPEDTVIDLDEQMEGEK